MKLRTLIFSLLLSLSGNAHGASLDTAKIDEAHGPLWPDKLAMSTD